MSVETSTSSALLRRAQVAGVAGFVVFGASIIGVWVARPLLLLWVFVGFVGLGSVLRGTQLTAAARRAQLAEQTSGTARSSRA